MNPTTDPQGATEADAARVSAATAEALLRECAEALQGVAEFRLPAAIDQRLLWLSEKVKAQALVQRLLATYPHLARREA